MAGGDGSLEREDAAGGAPPEPLSRACGPLLVHCRPKGEGSQADASDVAVLDGLTAERVRTGWNERPRRGWKRGPRPRLIPSLIPLEQERRRKAVRSKRLVGPLAGSVALVGANIIEQR